MNIFKRTSPSGLHWRWGLNRAAALAEWRQLLTRIDLGCASNVMRVLICLTAPELLYFRRCCPEVYTQIT